MIRTINDITIVEVNTAAQANAEQYEDRFKKCARAAFIEGVLWAQKECNHSKTEQP